MGIIELKVSNKEGVINFKTNKFSKFATITIEITNK